MFEAVGESKIGDDDISMAVEKEILEFEVPMYNFLLVYVPDAGKKLGEEFRCILFLEVTVSEDVVEQLAARCVFKDDSYVFVCFDHVVQTDDVWMFQRLKMTDEERSSGTMSGTYP